MLIPFFSPLSWKLVDYRYLGIYKKVRWLFSEHQRSLCCTWFHFREMCVCVCVCVSRSVVSDSETQQTVAHQVSLSMEFSKQEYWSRLPFTALPNPGTEPWSLASQADTLSFELQGSPSEGWLTLKSDIRCKSVAMANSNDKFKWWCNPHTNKKKLRRGNYVCNIIWG